MEVAFDVAIIGGGAIGCAVARRVCRSFKEDGKRMTCMVLEKNPDVISEASSGNTGHLATNFYYGQHDGRGAPLESMMCRNAANEHNEEWLRQQPNIPRRKAGLLFLARSDEEGQKLRSMLAAGEENGAKGLRLVQSEELSAVEPHLEIPSDVKMGLLSEDEYVIDPFLAVASNLYVAIELGKKGT